MAVTIKSDKKWHNFVYGMDLPKKWRKEFNWVKSDEEYSGMNFIKYRGWVHSLDEFSHIGNRVGYGEFRDWDGIVSDSYFSGVVIKVSSDGERYKIGRFSL